MNDIERVGKKGEQIAREYLKNIAKVETIFQADWIIKLDSEYFLLEVKHQEHFKAPPFNGHGLPPYQVKARMNFQRDTGIKTIFFVIEKPEDNIIYYQFLDKLEKTNYFDTKNEKRRIYNIEYFEAREIYPNLAGNISAPQNA